MSWYECWHETERSINQLTILPRTRSGLANSGTCELDGSENERAAAAMCGMVVLLHYMSTFKPIV
jgi:hypothetical protein